MAQEPQAASLRDVLSYTPDQYLSQDEIDWIQRTFTNPLAAKIIRKVMIPSVHDPELPLEQFAQDAWMSGTNWSQYADNHAKTLIVAREEAIKFVVGGIIKLKQMAATKPADPIEESFKRSKNSNQ